MLKSCLCNRSDVYILAKGTITMAPVPPPAAKPNNNDKEVVFKNCAPFTDCIREIGNAQIDNAKDIDIVMPMYNLIEHCNNQEKTLGSLWQYYRDESFLDDNDAIADFPAANNNVALFTFKKSNE